MRAFAVRPDFQHRAAPDGDKKHRASLGLLWPDNRPPELRGIDQDLLFLGSFSKEIGPYSHSKGVDGILVSEKNRCPLTPAVNKVSVGALELMEINCIREPPMFFRQCSKEGWKIFSTGPLEKSLEKKNLNYLELKLTKQVPDFNCE